VMSHSDRSIAIRRYSTSSPSAVTTTAALPPTVPFEVGVTNARFFGSSHGWLVVGGGHCETRKLNCSQYAGLLSTSDGSETLNDITPPSTPLIPQPPYRPPQHLPAPPKPAKGRTSTTIGPARTLGVTPETANNYGYDYLIDVAGLDRYGAPSLQQMQTMWDTASDYEAVSVYLGGINNAAGSHGSYTPDWIYGVECQGWEVIPLYVGLQAPCVGDPENKLAKMSLDPI